MPANADLRIVPARMETAKMRHVSQVGKVYAQLRDLIVDGRLAPGSRIVEVDLASRLTVSRTPIRDALRLLQQEGFVSASLPEGIKSRLIVAPLTQRDAEELYAIAGRMEGWAARLTAQLPAETRGALGQKLRELNDQLRETSESRRRAPQRNLALCTEFHRTVVEASAGPRLLTIHKAITLQAERYWRAYSHAQMLVEESVNEHDEVIRSIEEGNADRAEQGIVGHWQNAWTRLSEAIDALGERGSW